MKPPPPNAPGPPARKRVGRAASLHGCRCNAAPDRRETARPCARRFRNPIHRWRGPVQPSRPAPSVQQRPARGRSPPAVHVGGRFATGPAAALPPQWQQCRYQAWKRAGQWRYSDVRQAPSQPGQSATAHPIQAPLRATPGWPFRCRQPKDKPATARQFLPDAMRRAPPARCSPRRHPQRPPHCAGRSTIRWPREPARHD
ncbi:hypothetical protein D3C84_691960 [compost metagenome]